MKEEKNEIVESTFKMVQNFLKNPPLIVWGSGATVSFGIPSMGALNERLKKEISDFDIDNDNLEIELGKEKYQDKIPEIKKVIWNEINEADKLVLERLTTNNSRDFNGIKLLIQKFIEVHPQVLNIVTTNYDRVLEYTMSYYDILFTDGFSGKVLSSFNENLFQTKNTVNLIKVHGSLNWFNINGEIRYINSCFDKYTPQIIAPGKSKYQEAYNSPYRELIQKADNAIKEASSFLVVGFGFNDEHLTPRIKTQIKKGVPLVLITRKITDGTFKELKGAERYILFEENSSGQTNVIYKSSNSEIEQSIVLADDFWQLSKFMEIL